MEKVIGKMAEKEYIEREAAYPIAKKVVDAITNGEYHAGVFAYDIMDWIDELPAADVRPVVRGKWKQTGGKYSRHKTIDRRILTCSVCGNILYMEGVNAGRGDANFCPNCGADMRPKPMSGANGEES